MLRWIARRRLVPMLSIALFLQYEEVLNRPEHRLAHGLDAEGIRGFLGALASASESVVTRFRWRPQLRDPGDEMVLEVAVNGMAEALVTHDVRHFAAAGLRFGLRVLRPAELLSEVAE